MQLTKPAVVGTLESSDVQITLNPNSNKGIEVEIQSIVKATFGEAIHQTVMCVLNEFEIENAWVQVNDKGALDLVIRSRMQAAICRSAEVKYDWDKGGLNG